MVVGTIIFSYHIAAGFRDAFLRNFFVVYSIT